MKHSTSPPPTWPAPQRPGRPAAWPVFLATLFVLLGGESAQAQSFNGLAYAVRGEYVKITGFDCASSVVVIPDRIEGLPVTSIEPRAFQSCTRLTNVTIPDSVTRIGDWAFLGCTGLTSVTIGNSVTSIGDLAFAGCTGLTSVTIPNSVTSIGLATFQGCTGLTSITIPNSVTSIGRAASNGCTRLTAIEVDGLNPAFSSTEGVLFDKSQSTLIACPEAKPGSYTMPNSVTRIGDSAFQDCTGLTGVTIPNSVTHINYKAFRGCTGLTSVTIPDSVTTLGYEAFAYCNRLTGAIIGNSLTSMGQWAFRNCSGLTSVTIPNSLTIIQPGAFYACTGLTSVMIGNSVRDIGSGAFEGCISLTSVTLPNSVTRLGNRAFYACTSLTAAYFMGNAPVVGSGVFQNANNTTVYYLPGTTGWGATFGGRPTVQGSQPEFTSCPADYTASTDAGACTALLDFLAAASGVPAPTITCTLNGTPISAPFEFPNGVNEVTCTAVSPLGEATCTFTVTVNDTENPVIHSVTPSRSVLSPPNHKMVPVTVVVSATDNCQVAGARIVGITSNEALNGTGDGNTASDWQVTGDLDVQLRAERSGNGSGRVYTITVEVSDEAGNTAQQSTTVTVPH